MKPMTRRERRAGRQRRYEAAREVRLTARLDYRFFTESNARRETDYEALLPGWLRPLDYKVSSESGALKVHSRVRTWHLGGRANGHAPKPGQRWDRTGPTYVTGYRGTRLPKPVIDHQWRRMMADK